MESKKLNRLLQQTVSELSQTSSLYGLCHECDDGAPLPSGPILTEIVELCREILFPGFYGKSNISIQTLVYHIGVCVGTERLQLLGYGRARLADGYEGYFLHFSISIGL